MQKILRLQKDAIDADAVFGCVDPRNSNTVQLKEMFQAQTLDQRRVYGGQRGSSAKQWGDQEEFATPNMLLKQEAEHYVIDHKAVEISQFNPFAVQASRSRSPAKIRHLQLSSSSKI